MHRTHCGIVPPHLLTRLAALQDPRLSAASRAARHALLELQPVHRIRADALRAPVRRGSAVVGTLARRIHDAGGREELPGTAVRPEGGPVTGDAAADEAYDGLGATYRLFSEEYGRSSIDGAGKRLDATVHYGSDYDNAFWDGERMVFGDGDGEIFGRFTASLTVISHELTHGFTQYSTNLEYQGQSGALNESLSDVFGVLVEQRELGQDAAAAPWLIGAGIFTEDVQGVALRSLKAPGTAYDDDVLGRDPQPATMADYVRTTSDNGGVHINSGIPNHAFYRAATALGGEAWKAAGSIWYDAVLSGDIPSDCDFPTFARATVRAADKRFGSGSREVGAVAEAWAQVGVVP
ncbi:M4 family metallopeptidase [Arthrobacter agilis]|uniref:M4 family metallopeptidase n=1 Tax=Arthrobacter agilis TaxID=37921 RepID=UPI000B3606F9|nr:M4 family metallopeptidase [Arthrobacter agilis]OUM43123.1 peptidase M4 family protein [Arthrobacter agilis]PPB46067.1 M4 family peptidase [Arthrobacter agilis]TPV25610.1 M4 family metallopeptidase [Arthrobacter agilis]VDR33379.1 Protease prtS precursor [Arthrobacter agilis]